MAWKSTVSYIDRNSHFISVPDCRLLQLVTTNEDLEQENKSLKDGTAASGHDQQQASQAQDEMRHLQAQNAALQKNLAGQTCH